jgi:hypothetical protein
LNIKYVKVLPHSIGAEKIYSSAFAESGLSRRQDTGAKFELRPPLDTIDPEEQAHAGLSFVGVPVGTDRFVEIELEKSVCEAERAVVALVDFANKGPQDTPRTAARFNHASYAMHLFSLCGTTRFDYLYHNIPPRIMDKQAVRIQTLLDSSFAKITGIWNRGFETHRRDNICTEAFLRFPARLGGHGVPDVKVVSPVAYLSTLSATCRPVVDSLPDAWKLRRHYNRPPQGAGHDKNAG